MMADFLFMQQHTSAMKSTQSLFFFKYYNINISFANKLSVSPDLSDSNKHNVWKLQNVLRFSVRDLISFVAKLSMRILKLTDRSCYHDLTPISHY